MVGDSNTEPDSDISSTSPVARSTVNDMPNEGDFVIVTHEGDHYPGEVKSSKKNGVQVSCMMKTEQYWKWLSKLDLLVYHISSIKANSLIIRACNFSTKIII